MFNKTYIELIKNYFKDKPVERVWLFGSYARGEEKPSSDIDLLVDFSTTVSLLNHAGFILELEELLERPVDLIEQDSLCPELRTYVDHDKILIYERGA